jgi:hypothetical protein
MTRAFPGIRTSNGGKAPASPEGGDEPVMDLERRRDQLSTQLAELQWDLGGLAYEMATRDRVRVDLIVKQAAAMQDVDAELSEIERIMALEKTSVAGLCPNCKAPHSSGAAFCWQCGHPIMRQVDTASLLSDDA